MKYLLPFAFLFIYFSGWAQKTYQYQSIPVSDGTKAYAMPFAGGINAAQILHMDLNGNGTEELVIWDINSRNIKVFEAQDGSYRHLPYMHHYFPPDVSGFLVLADYDGDGKKDLFTSTAFGIKAYRNTTGIGSNYPSWEVARTFLPLENGSNFPVNNLDVPAIQDIDGDGDLDVVVFNFAVGDYLEFYKNTSIERTGRRDIDGFANPVVRWGNFEFCGCGNFSFGQTCDGDPISRKIPNPENNAILHAGGHSIMLRDFNGDGLLDLVMGQDQCSSLYYLPNEGSNTAPVFTSFSTSLPGFGPFPQFPVFHVPQEIGDEFFVSSNSSQTTLTAGIDFAQSLYQLDANQNPSLVTTAFLQEDMVDLGENSRPFFKGNRSAGDLIITANILKEGSAVGQAFRYEMTPSGLSLAERDFLNLSRLGLTELQYLEYQTASRGPIWFVSGVNIEDFLLVRHLYFTYEESLEELQETTIPNITLRSNDHLEFYQEEGEDYLLLARQTGQLMRFKVTFGDNINFELLDQDYLGFSDDPSQRNLVVKTIKKANQIDLYAINQSGILTYLTDFTNPQNPSTPIRLAMPDGTTQNTKLGRNTWIATVPEAFGERTHLILGNNAGGILMLEDISNSIDPPIDGKLQVKLYPNPTSGPVWLLSNAPGKARLVNSLGQVLVEEVEVEANSPREMDLRTLASGMYYLQFTSDSGQGTTKKLIMD